MENLLNYGYAVGGTIAIIVFFTFGIQILFACLAGSTAKKKGRSYGAWWCLSFFVLGFIALIIVCCLSDESKNQPVMKQNWICPKCYAVNESNPYCNGNEFCPHCGSKRGQ